MEVWVEVGGEKGWVLAYVYAGRLSGLEQKSVCSFRLALDMVRVLSRNWYR
jgi:hypothetical protein